MKKTLISLFLVISVVMSVFSIGAFAENKGVGTYKVTAASLAMRSSANDNSKKVSSIPKNTEIIVTKTSNNWGYTAYESSCGWVRMDNLQYINSSLDLATKKYIVNATTLNVRSGAGTSYEILGTLQHGDIVTVTNRSASGDWSYVKSGIYMGWVSSKYLTEYVDTTISKTTYLTKYTTNKSTTLRTGYGAEFNSRLSVPSGTTIYSGVTKNKYALTVYNGMLGWLDTATLTKTGTSTLTSLPAVDRSKTSFIAGDGAAYAAGIDVSKWNGTINWKEVKSSGIDFVIIRMGTSKLKDPNFETNYKGAKDAGLGVGGYIYSYSSTVADAESDAKLCLDWLKGKQMDYPIYYDIEDEECHQSNSKTLNTNIVKKFIDTMMASNWYAGVYTGANWWSTELDYDSLSDKYESWIARYYSDSPSGTYDYASVYGMYQYSCKGKIGGINGDVDLDVAYKDYPTIIKNGGYNGYASLISRNTNIARPLGDADCDDFVSMSDVTYIQRAIAKLVTLNEEKTALADANEDGNITLEDVVEIQLYLAKLPSLLAKG